MSVPCQPDFMLRCDQPGVRPVAIFADGFEPHVRPDEVDSRQLADDINKRRAILASGRYWVWGLSWDDLDEDAGLETLAHGIVDKYLRPKAAQVTRMGHPAPRVDGLTGNPCEQLLAFIERPVAPIWRVLMQACSGMPMAEAVLRGGGSPVAPMLSAFEGWRSGGSISPWPKGRGDWFWLARIGPSPDLLAYGPSTDLAQRRYDNLRIALRLEDAAEERASSGYKLRWRRFLALSNLFQFLPRCTLFTTSEARLGEAPELDIAIAGALSTQWQEVIEDAVSSLEQVLTALAHHGCTPPRVEYYNEALGDEVFAELAWPDRVPPLVVLSGDQAGFAEQWRLAGWTVATDNDLQTHGVQWLARQLAGAPNPYREAN